MSFSVLVGVSSETKCTNSVRARLPREHAPLAFAGFAYHCAMLRAATARAATPEAARVR
jgi:hypothetical protein